MFWICYVLEMKYAWIWSSLYHSMGYSNKEDLNISIIYISSCIRKKLIKSLTCGEFTGRL